MQTYSRMPKYASGYKPTIAPGQGLHFDVGTMGCGPMLERNTRPSPSSPTRAGSSADTLDFPALAEPARPGRARPGL